MNRRNFLKILGGGAVAAAIPEINAANAPYGISSQLTTKSTPKLRTVKYIVLHTIEGDGIGQVAGIQKGAKAHYVVMKGGGIYRTVDKSKVAYHAGRSRWGKDESLNTKSIGIEMEGFHFQEPTPEQAAALRWLVAELKAIYGLTDDDVVTHSMVRYSRPNKYFKRNHRFRPCAMLYATPTVRKAIGLSNTFSGDPNVVAKQIINADKYLAAMLYGPNRPPVYRIASWEDRDPRADQWVRGQRTGNSVQPKPQQPVANGKTVLGTIQPGKGPASVVGNEWDKASTVYVFGRQIEVGSKIAPLVNKLPVGTIVAANYNYGTIPKGGSAFSLAKGKWNDALTVYILPSGEDFRGNEITPGSIQPGTIVLWPK